MTAVNLDFILWAPLLSVVLTLLITPPLLRYAQIRLLDVPVARSSHVLPTPKGGGLGFATAILAALLITRPEGFALLFATSMAIVAVSFLDDLKGLHQLPRVTVQLVSATVLVSLIPGWPSLSPLDRLHNSDLFIGFIFIGCLVWSVNLYNFMDGLDGLATSEGVFISIGLAGLALWADEWRWALFFTGSGTALLAFLKFNWPPAKLFMGDSGSAFLGWLFGSGSLLLAGTTSIPIWLPLMLVSVFVTDASLTLLRRFINGEQIFDAHRSHLYQVLADRLGGHSKTVWLYMSLNVFLVAPMVVVAAHFPDYAVVLCLALYLLLFTGYVLTWAWTRLVYYRIQQQRLAALHMRRSPLSLLLAADGVAVGFAVLLAYLVRLGPGHIEELQYEWLLAPLVALASCYAFYRLGVYRIAVKNMVNADLWVLSVASILSSVILAASGFLSQAFMPRSLPLVYFLILLALIGGGRVVSRAISRGRIKPHQIPALIINLEGKGERVIADLNLDSSLLPVGIVDVRAELKGEVVEGMKVYSPSELDEVVAALNVKHLLVVGSSVPRYLQRYWTRAGQKAGVSIYCLHGSEQRLARHYAPRVSTWVPANLPSNEWSKIDIIQSSDITKTKN